MAFRHCPADSPDPDGVSDFLVPPFPGGRCASPGLTRVARSGRDAIPFTAVGGQSRMPDQGAQRGRSGKLRIRLRDKNRQR